jgi:hypothetical protein
MVNSVRPRTTPGSCAVPGALMSEMSAGAPIEGEVGAFGVSRTLTKIWCDIKPSWARLNQLIEFRNAIAHGLGQLTRVQRAKRASAATQIALAKIRLSGDRIVLEEANLQNVKDACAALICLGQVKTGDVN